MCSRIFESGKRGAIPESCPQCRDIDYKQRYYRYRKKGRPLSINSPLHFREAIERANGHCEICFTTERKLYVHHKDGNGFQSKIPNHSTDNLIVVCQRCHMKLHMLVRCADLEKLIEMRQKNMTLQEIATHYGVSRQRIHQLIKNKV